jgi:hypothetical protein
MEMVVMEARNDEPIWIWDLGQTGLSHWGSVTNLDHLPVLDEQGVTLPAVGSHHPCRGDQPLHRK